MRIAVLLALLLSGCQPVGDCMAGSTSLVKRLPLSVQIGNPGLDVFAGEGWPNPYFGRVGFDVSSMPNIDIQYSGGTLYMVPDPTFVNPTFNRYRYTMWLDTGEESNDGTTGDVPPDNGQTFFNLEGNEVYFRWLPMTGGDDDWDMTFQMYDFGEGGSPNFFFLLVEWYFDPSTGGEVFINIDEGPQGETQIFTDWDPVVDGPMWVRAREESGTVYVDLATDACTTSGSAWTNYASWPVVYGPINSMSMEFTMDLHASFTSSSGDALVRTSSGLVERFHFNHFAFQFDTGDWTAGPNVDGITLDGNDMLNVDVSGRGVAYRNALGSRTESFIFARGAINVGENHGWVGAAGHFADSSNLVDAQVAFAGGSAGYALIERVGGTAINVDQPTATTRSKSFETNVALWLDDSDAESRASEAPPNDEATISLSTLASGFVGLFVQPISAADTIARFSHWVVMESRYVTITGVASGRIVKVRLADDSVVAQATSTGGDTVVDVIEGSWALGENAIPSNIAVFESDGTTLVTELDLTVWGGDTYELSTGGSGGDTYPDAATGFIGPLNQQPLVRRLPLKVAIGDPKVFGLAKRLPLKVQVGDP